MDIPNANKTPQLSSLKSLKIQKPIAPRPCIFTPATTIMAS